MEFAAKIGTMPLTRIKVKNARKAPKVGDLIKVKEMTGCNRNGTPQFDGKWFSCLVDKVDEEYWGKDNPPLLKILKF